MANKETPEEFEVDPQVAESDTQVEEEIEGSAEFSDAEIIAQLQEQLAAAVADASDQVLRAKAEAQNVRRRAELDVEKAHKFALDKFVNELLPVLDSLERAIDACPEGDDAVDSIRQGVEMTISMFVSALNKFAVVAVDPQGEPFDPQVHQAMSMVENPDVEPNTVIAVMQKGYMLNDRLVRPAMVMVSKAAQA